MRGGFRFITDWSARITSDLFHISYGNAKIAATLIICTIAFVGWILYRNRYGNKD